MARTDVPVAVHQWPMCADNNLLGGMQASDAVAASAGWITRVFAGQPEAVLD